MCKKDEAKDKAGGKIYRKDKKYFEFYQSKNCFDESLLWLVMYVDLVLMKGFV